MGSTSSSSSVPFKRTTAVANRRQMLQALRSGEGPAKDGFGKTKTKGTAIAHRLHHLGFRACSPNVVTEGTDEAADLWKALAQSELARAAFREALRLGKVRPRTLKLMFVGQGRAGKTSTLKALTGQTFQPNEESTHGLHATMPLVRAVTLDVRSALVSQWQVVARSEHEIHGAELERSCAQYVAERMRDVDSSEALQAEPDGGEAWPEDGITKMSVDLVARLIQNNESGLDDEEDEPVMLKTWDFGGQREYYVMHHLFLTNRGIYLVVTRLDSWLVPNLETPEGEESPAVTGEDGGAFEPPLEALTFWLSSIHVHAPDAMILIVGTHADRVADCQKEVEDRVEEEIVQLMERVPGVERQVVVNGSAGLCFFPVDNSGLSGLTSDSGLPELQQAIDREASTALAPGGSFGQELPLPWVRLREMLEDASEGSTGDDGVLPLTATFVLDLAKVRAMGLEAGICGGDEELLQCLTVLHSFGSIVFFDEDGLRDHVVLSTQWLADAMAHILNCPRVVQGAVAAARRLRERGELEDELLLRTLWRPHKFREHHNVLLQMLHRFDLVIPLGAGAGSGGAVHVVPSLLPVAPPQVIAATPRDAEVWGSLFFDFHGLLCRLLPTLFPKLVAASSREADVDVVGSLGLYRDSFRLLWMGHEIAMDLLPRERPQVVRVQSVEGTGLPLCIVQSLLRLVKVTLAQSSHLSFTAGVLCEHCHARAGERQHVIDVNELLSDKRVPCRVSARVVVVPEHCWASEWRESLESQASAPFPPPLPPVALTAYSSVESNWDMSPNERSQSPAPTVSTEPSLMSSRMLQSEMPHGTSVSLLYASPVWRQSEAGGSELPPLDMHQEATMLAEAAQNSGAAVVVSLATASNLARLLTSAPEATEGSSGLILHLSLHCGDSGQVLLLEDDYGGAHEFSLEDLRGLLAATGGAQRLQLVFLHACCSDLAGSIFLAAGAPHVVCCRGAVFDATARAFTRAFYQAFCGGGKSVAQAFEIARFEIRTAPQPGLRAEAEKYLLLPRDDPQHGFCFCAAIPRGVMSLPFLYTSALVPARVEDFCGRARDIWLLMQHLSSSRRCVVVAGPSQIGKSALLTEIARFTGSPGRRYAYRALHVAPSPEEVEEDLGCGDSQGQEPRHLLLALLRALGAAVGRSLEAVGGESWTEGAFTGFSTELSMESQESMASLGLSSHSEARMIRSRVVQGLQRLEAKGQRTLLILDEVEPFFASPAACDEIRKLLSELLLRTERLEIMLGARQAPFQALGAHKVVAYPVESLRPTDAARLFLWRVHRPLVVADLSEAALEAAGGEAAVSQGLPLIMNAQNRGMVLSQLSSHPLLQRCAGMPGHLRAVADHVLPGNGSLWEIHRRHSGE
ncbi:unnamed protein product [Polarella glacialis]|uniref:non-specific serine/threonine protein kinase n=1 Tax=Polarella glacialis TaxID=89957 RepID=A0A813LP11_POLGL|nr:unnamed protein product [Polarella glacialis]